jgi:hypothetical protein
MLNGKLPSSELVVIPWDGRDRVRTYALASLSRLNEAFRARFGHNLVVNEGYRDYATQKAYYSNPPSGVGTAAVPGTSNHGWGLAVDLKLTTQEYKWMLANAPRFGWVNPPWARDGKGVEEPWHWEHIGSPVVIPDVVAPHELTRKEITMFLVVAKGRGHAYAATGHWHKLNGEELAVLDVARSKGVVTTLDFTNDPDGGNRRYDVLHAILTHNDPSW